MVQSLVFFFKQKTAYEMRISDWSSDVCSSDLTAKTRSADSVTFRTMVLATFRCILPACHTAAADGGGLRAAGPLSSWRAASRRPQIGRASCRERVCQYV